MDLRQLRYFVQIAESGSFSRAAEVLHVAQPSLSQQIKNLEEELGVSLLSRNARGIVATDLGTKFYDHARRILDEAERTKDAMRLQSTHPSGRVTVGLPTSACRGLSIPLVQAISEKQPNITLYIVEAMTSYLSDYIHAGRIDVALLYDHKAYEHVAWTEMISEDLVLFMRPDHPLAKKTSYAFADLAHTPIVLPGRSNAARTVMEQFAARCDLTLKVMDCDSLPTIVKLVSQLGHLAVMPHFAFTDELARGELVAVPIVDPTPSWRLSVVVSQKTMNNRGSQAVAEVMANVISQMVEQKLWLAQLIVA